MLVCDSSRHVAVWVPRHSEASISRILSVASDTFPVSMLDDSCVLASKMARRDRVISGVSILIVVPVILGTGV
jgi:hypothetical protein